MSIITEEELNNRCNLIASIGEEIIGQEAIKRLLVNKKNVYAYDGFEPSGRMHLAQGIMRAHNVNKFLDAGVKFKFWVADWFALMNLKLGGDLKKNSKSRKRYD
jgi:tyrosyl-tRNA synthetase